MFTKLGQQKCLELWMLEISLASWVPLFLLSLPAWITWAMAAHLYADSCLTSLVGFCPVPKASRDKKRFHPILGVIPYRRMNPFQQTVSYSPWSPSSAKLSCPERLPQPNLPSLYWDDCPALGLAYRP